MRRRLSSARAVALLGALLSINTVGNDLHGQPSQSAILGRAKAALEAGQFAVAEAIYDSTIASARDSATKGQGYFGRAYSSQRRLMADRDSLAPSEAKAIVDDYLRAAELDSSLAIPATSNGSAALQAAGLKDAAIQL